METCMGVVRGLVTWQQSVSGVDGRFVNCCGHWTKYADQVPGSAQGGNISSSNARRTIWQYRVVFNGLVIV